MISSFLNSKFGWYWQIALRGGWTSLLFYQCLHRILLYAMCHYLEFFHNLNIVLICISYIMSKGEHFLFKSKLYDLLCSFSSYYLLIFLFDWWSFWFARVFLFFSKRKLHIFILLCFPLYHVLLIFLMVVWSRLDILIFFGWIYQYDFSWPLYLCHSHKGLPCNEIIKMITFSYVYALIFFVWKWNLWFS